MLVRLTLLLRLTNKSVSLVASKEFARLTAGLFLCNYLNPSQLMLTAPVRGIPARKTAFFLDADLKNNFPSTKQPLFVDETANSKIKSLNLRAIIQEDLL